VKNDTAQVEHEASTSKIGEDQLFYCRQRGLTEEDATSMIVNGFCRDVFDELPMEFAVEAQALMRRQPRRGGGLMLLHQEPHAQLDRQARPILNGLRPRGGRRRGPRA
jgi:hypothetical protein